MLNRLRGSISSFQESLGKAAASLLPYPSAWTAIGFLLSITAGLAYWIGPVWAGGLLLLLSGFLDVVDGAVARSTGKVSNVGAFLDSSLDRFAEIAVYMGLMAGLRAPQLLILTAISLSLMVSYLRARLESLSHERPKGLELGERAERLLILGVLSVAGIVWIGVVIVLILALETVIERFVIYGAQLRREST